MHRKDIAGFAEHDIAPDIQVIRIDELNDAYSKVEQGEVRFRYVIDLASLQATPD